MSDGYGGGDVKQEQMTQTQKKTFTRWMNYFLSERLLKVDDLFKDLRDGVKLIHLLELISSKKLGKYVDKPKLPLHELGNINLALDFVKAEGLKIVNIDAQDINKGTPKLTLGLIWTIILRYQITQGGDGASPKQELLDWINRQIAPYKQSHGIGPAEDFTKSFQDGKILSALADSIQPGLIDCNKLGDPLGDTQNAMNKSEDAFSIPQLVDAQDMVYRPDEHSNMTYLSCFRDYVMNEGKRKNEVALKGPRANMCFAKGKGVEGGWARKPLPFTIHSRTVNDEPVIGKYMQDFKVVVTGPTGEVPNELKNNGDGTFFCKYIAPQGGDYHVAIDLLGNPKKGENTGPIKGSVYHLKVKEPSDPTKSWADGPGLERAYEGEPAFFTVHARDRNGKPVAGDNVQCTVKQIEGGSGDVPCEVKDLGDGDYSVRYDPKGVGKYRVDVTINDERIRDMPKDVQCYPSIDPTKTTVEGPGVTGGMTGRPLPFTIRSMDKTGQPIRKGGADFKVNVSGPDGQFQVEVKDNGDGTYDGAYEVKKPGDYKVMVTVKGNQPVGKSPYRVPIRAGADPASSFGVGRGWDEAWDCIPAKFTIHAKDLEGKPVPGEIVKVTMHNITSNAKKQEIARQVEKMDPYIRKRKQAKADKIIAERKQLALDSKRKAEEKGEKLPEIRIAEGGDVPVEVRDNGDGTYLAEYVAKNAGEYRIDVQIGPGLKHMKESPKQVPVHLAKPKVVFWRHTHAKEKEDMEFLKKRLEKAEALLSKNGLSLQ